MCLGITINSTSAEEYAIERWLRSGWQALVLFCASCWPLLTKLDYRSCGQPADRASCAAVSHNCSIFTLHTYTYTQVIPDLTGDNAVIPDLTGGLTGRGSRWITFIATAVLVIISYPISSLPTQRVCAAANRSGVRQDLLRLNETKIPLRRL